MDFIILNSDGSLQKQSLTRYIQQGSHGVDEIFIGWVNATSSQTLQAVFTLPNQLTNTELGVFKEDYEYEPGETMNGWVITLTENQTRYNGALMVSARIILNGIVQVAYPFALCINETGVRPDIDSGVTLAQLDSYLLNIQNIVANNVSMNVDSALSNTSKNPVQNKVITNAIETFKRGSYTKVDTTEYPTLQDFLNSEGEEGYLYLYPVNTSDEDKGYYQYIWENDLWIPLGTTKIDIANMVTTDTEQTISGEKTFTANIKSNANIVFPQWTIKDLGDGDLAFTFNINNSNKFYIRNGYILAQTTRPISHNAYDLGTSDVNWKDLHLSGVVYIGSGSQITQSADGNLQVTLSGDGKSFKPSWNGHYNLGSASYKWNCVYANYVSDGTNTIAVANIANKNNIKTINGQPIYAEGGGNLSIVASPIMTKVADNVSTYALTYGTPYLIVLKNGDSITINGVSYYGTFFITHTNHHTYDTHSGFAGEYGYYGIVDINGTRITYSSLQLGSGSPSSPIQEKLTITCASGGSNLVVYHFSSIQSLTTLNAVKQFLALPNIDIETKRSVLVRSETNSFSVDIKITNPETNVSYTMPIYIVEVDNYTKLVDGVEVSFLGAKCQFAYALPDNVPLDEREQVECDSGETFKSGIYYYTATSGGVGDKVFTPLVEGTDYQVGGDIDTYKSQHNVYVFKHAWSNTQYGSGGKSTANVIRYGSNVIHESNLMKWLNGKGTSWFVPSHLGDRLGNWYEGKNGFKDWLNQNDLALIEDNVAYGIYERDEFLLANNKFYAMFALPSGTEIAGSVNANEGSVLEYWKYLNGGVVSNDANANRTIKKITNITASQYAWLRSPTRSDSCSGWHVHSSGIVGNYYAYDANAVLPIFTI